MTTHSYVQVPPDSTGKKLASLEHVVGGNTVQAQLFHLADNDNPDNIQRVDARGQAYTRFAEGSPTLDAFGNLRVSSSSIVGGYEYTNGDMADLFQDISLVGGSIIWNQQAAQTILSVSSTTGSTAIRTTNRYHYYQPGVGNLIIITLAHGDTGKANNVRRWGYFDTQNGPYFELNGTTLNVVLRSYTTGTLVETRIPQSQWNGDKLDGTGISQMTIDVTKANFYFIDYAWLGVGPVRMGVLSPDGARWICHTYENPNNNLGAYMATGSLPLRWENFNTDTTASTSEMKTICAAIYAESGINYTFWRYADIEREVPVEVTTNTPIFSMKVKPGSRIGIYPECLNALVSGGDVKLTIVDDATLTGATWSITGGGVALGDIGATAAVGGEKFKTWYATTGVTRLDLKPIYETNDEGYHRLADDSDSYTFTLLATKLSGTTVTIAATLNYRELA